MCEKSISCVATFTRDYCVMPAIFTGNQEQTIDSIFCMLCGVARGSKPLAAAQNLLATRPFSCVCKPLAGVRGNPGKPRLSFFSFEWPGCNGITGCDGCNLSIFILT